MKYAKYPVKYYRLDDEPSEEKEDKPQTDPGMLMKKLEKYFFETRTVQLWGPVDDRSAKDIINKFLLLDADKPGTEIRFLINSPGGMVTSGMAIYDVMKMMKSPVSTVCIGLAASMGSILLSGGVKGRTIYLSPWRSNDPPAKSWRLYPGCQCGFGNPGKTD